MRRILFSLFLIPALLLTTHSAQASVCCPCQKDATKYCVNLSDVADCEGAQLKSASLSNLQQGNQSDFNGFTCSGGPYDATQCQLVKDGGLCGSTPLAPADLLVSLKGAPASSGGSAPVDTTPTEIPNPVVPFLGVPIPGYTPSTKIPIVNGDIVVPYLAQYISAFYRAAIGLSIIFAIIMIMVGGFQYILSGAIEGVKSGKKKIVDAFTALIVLFSAFAIFNTIAPNTLNLEGIRLPTSINWVPDEGDIQSTPQTEPASAPPTGAAPCTSPGQGCTDKKTCEAACADPSKRTTCSPNVADPSATTIIPNTRGIDNRGNTRILTELLPQIRAAGEAAAARGYTLMFATTFSGYRPLAAQWATACNKLAGVLSKPQSIAFPGGSTHGRGRAIDINLMQGNRTLVPSGDACIQTDAQYHAASTALTEIMTGLGWRRLKQEMWHFEYGTNDPRLCSGNDCLQPPYIPVPKRCK